MKSGIITLICASIFINGLHGETVHLSIPTRINVEQFLNGLSLIDRLILLSLGNLGAVVMRPDVALKLATLEREINNAFERSYAEFASREDFPEEQFAAMELQFKQNAALALYAVLYAEVAKQIATEGTDEQKIIFNAQLTPEALTKIITEPATNYAVV